MSQWSNLTDEEVLERAEQHARRYTSNYIDMMCRGGFIKEIVDRGLDKVFDISRIHKGQNPEYAIAAEHYKERPRIFLTQQPIPLPRMHANVGSHENYPVCLAFPAPTYVRTMFLYLRDPDLYVIPEDENAMEQILTSASAKLGYFYILRAILEERPHSLHIDVTFGTFRPDFAMDLINAINQEITGRIGVEQVVVHGLTEGLAAQLVEQHNGAHGKGRYIAFAALVD